MVRPAPGNCDAQRIRWAFFLGALLLASCSRVSPERRAEFEQISRAIDVLRNAPNEHKAQRIQPLRELSCDAYCDLRDTCVSAYEIHIAALELIERARSKPNLIEEELDQAELRLGRAKDAATACAAEQGRLRLEMNP